MRTKLFTAVILWATILLLSFGCSKSDEETATTVDPQSPEIEEASVDDLIDSLISDSDDAAPGEQVSTRDASVDEEAVPQQFLDAPVRNVVMKHANGKAHKAFQAKQLGPQSVIQHGRYEEYFATGQRLKAGSYEYGKKIGEWSFWDQTGTLRKQGTYIKDRQDGDWKKFRKDGSLEWIEKYQDGLADGTWEAYRDDGKTVLWRRGYKTGARDGAWEDFGVNGTRLALVTYREGKLHGDSKSWNEAGKLIGEGAYQGDKRHGRFRVFDEDGDKVVEESLWEAGVRQRGG